jgi:hypothetical protein
LATDSAYGTTAAAARPGWVRPDEDHPTSPPFGRGIRDGPADSSAIMYGWSGRVGVAPGQLDELAPVHDRDPIRQVADDGRSWAMNRYVRPYCAWSSGAVGDLCLDAASRRRSVRHRQWNERLVRRAGVPIRWRWQQNSWKRPAMPAGPDLQDSRTRCRRSRRSPMMDLEGSAMIDPTVSRLFRLAAWILEDDLHVARRGPVANAHGGESPSNQTEPAVGLSGASQRPRCSCRSPTHRRARASRCDGP